MCRENSRFQDNRQFSKGIIRRFDVHPLVRWHKQRIRDWPTGQSRRLFWQIFFSHSIPADTKTVAPFNDCLRELVQIFPAKVGITEITIKIGYGEHHPVAVLRPVSQIVGDQSGQDIGRQFLRANQLKTFHSKASTTISSKRIVHAPSVEVERAIVWYWSTLERHTRSKFLSN